MRYILGIVTMFVLVSCQSQVKQDSVINKEGMVVNDSVEVATLGAGCFWCIEAVYQELNGVQKVESGYMGGAVIDPSYRAVCEGTTGHAEVAQITFDPNVVSFSEVLEVFFNVHDPTTLNRQGADSGTQYRSAIFYHSEEQKNEADEIKKELDLSEAWDNPIVTEITKASTFYIADNYHQNYMENNPDQGYCRVIIRPKLEKFRKVFKNKLKK